MVSKIIAIIGGLIMLAVYSATLDSLRAERDELAAQRLATCRALGVVRAIELHESAPAEVQIAAVRILDDAASVCRGDAPHAKIGGVDL